MITEEEKKRQREIRRKLDEVVGTDFDAPRGGLREWLRGRWIKWLLGAVFGVLAMLLVFYTIESHRVPPVQPVQAPHAKKPIPVQIIPAR